MSKQGKQIIAVILVIVLLRSGIIGRIRYQFFPCESVDIFLRKSACRSVVPVGATIGEIALSPNESLLAIDQINDRVALYEISDQKINFRGSLFLDFDNKYRETLFVTEIQFSPSGELIAIVKNNSFVQIWDVETNDLINEFDLAKPKEEHRQRLRGWSDVTFLDERNLIAIYQRDQEQIDIFNIETSNLLASVPGRYISSSPSADQFAVVTEGAEIHLWSKDGDDFSKISHLQSPEIIESYAIFNSAFIERPEYLDEVIQFNQSLDGVFVQYAPDGKTLAVMGIVSSPINRDGERSWMPHATINLYDLDKMMLIKSIESPIPIDQDRMLFDINRSYHLAIHHVFHFDGESIYWVFDSSPESSGLSVSNFPSGAWDVSPPVRAYLKKWDIEGELIAEKEFSTNPYRISGFTNVALSPVNNSLMTLNYYGEIMVWEIPN